LSTALAVKAPDIAMIEINDISRFVMQGGLPILAVNLHRRALRG
jgi:hypothetical protein